MLVTCYHTGVAAPAGDDGTVGRLEIGMMLGGHAEEDKFWLATLRAFRDRLGTPDAPVTQIGAVQPESRTY